MEQQVFKDGSFGVPIGPMVHRSGLSNILAVLRHWIPASTNHHTIATAEKTNCNEKSLESVSNDYDNNGGES